jgi:hypothetical protein
MKNVKVQYIFVSALNHQTMKAYVRAEMRFHAFFTSTLEGNECLASGFGALVPENVLPVQFE